MGTLDESTKESVNGRVPEGTADEPPEDSGRGGSGCGVRLAAMCFARKQDSSTGFAERLQRMILQCRKIQEGQGMRFRIFDNCNVKEKLPDGPEMELAESRCTLFRKLREISGVTEDQFYDSMCAHPFGGGKVEVSGKSGSIFLRSSDNELVLKTIEEHEFEVLNAVLPHMMLYFEQRKNSLLSRFFGAYALTIDGKTLRIVAMTNVLKRKSDWIYDLKGTTEDRWVDPTTGGVLKDRNFKYTMLFDLKRRKDLLQAIVDDADFLDSVGVMDYSLLVSTKKIQEREAQTPDRSITRTTSATMYPQFSTSESGDNLACMSGTLRALDGSCEEVEFQFGIIDILQCWTPKKIAAHWFKKTTIGCFHEIDSEPPAVYRQRFCKFFLAKIEALGSRPIRADSIEWSEAKDEKSKR